MKETIPQSQYERDVWQRVMLEAQIGTEACKRLGLLHPDYIKNHHVQLELDYED
jgi:hypothetical protein